MPAATGASRSRGASAASKNGKAKTFTVRGVKFTLPETVPMRIAKLYDDGEVMAYLEAILGEEQMERVWSMELPTGKLQSELEKLLVEIVKKTDEALGLGSGE